MHYTTIATIIFIVISIIFVHWVTKESNIIRSNLSLISQAHNPDLCVADALHNCVEFKNTLNPLDQTDRGAAIMVGTFVASVLEKMPELLGTNYTLINYSGDPTMPFAIVYSNGTVVIRGTLTQKDAFKDFEAFETTEPNLIIDPSGKLVNAGITVHAGFNSIYQDMKPQFMAALASIDKVFICAHSLGCGISLLLAFDLLAYKKTVKIVNFAPPRAGNAAFVNALAAADITAYINVADVVPTVPPSYIVYNGVMYQFAHAGKLIHFTSLQADLANCHSMAAYLANVTI